jgi:NADH dehydrogenase/NADH:ubiquinone oxidoreductase subunit G
MVVETESRKRDTRRFVGDALRTTQQCMTCEVNGDCELQDLAYEYEAPWPA